MDALHYQEINSFMFNKKNTIIAAHDESDKSPAASKDFLAQMLANFENIGYDFDKEALEIFKTMTESELVEQVYEPVLNEAKMSLGSHVAHNVLFPRFPQSVMTIDLDDLSNMRFMSYFAVVFDMMTGNSFDKDNSLTHNYLEDNVADMLAKKMRGSSINIGKEKKSQRGKDTVRVKRKKIEVTNLYNYYLLLNKMLSSKMSLSEYDKEHINWAIKNMDSRKFVPEKIPFKETEVLINNLYFNNNQVGKIDIKTIEDFERLLASLTCKNKMHTVNQAVGHKSAHFLDKYAVSGDTSLSQKQYFRNFTNQERKKLLAIFNHGANKNTGTMVESMTSKRAQRFKETVLDKRLHFNTASHNSTYTTIWQIASNLNRKYQEYESALMAQDYVRAAVMLDRISPNALARHIETLVNKAYQNAPKTINGVMNVIQKSVDKMDPIILMNIKKDLQAETRNPYKVDFIRGDVLKFNLRENTSPELPNEIKDKLCEILTTKGIHSQFKTHNLQGKVYIDPDLQGCPIPVCQRNDGGKKNTVVTGTQLPINRKETDILRAVLYKKCPQNGFFDFSAALLDENYNFVKQVSWNNLKETSEGKLIGWHSGDCSQSSVGVSEIIDLNINEIKKQNPEIKYVAYMDVAWNKSQKISDCTETFIAFESVPKVQMNIKNAKDATYHYNAKNIAYKMDITGATQQNLTTLYDIENNKIVFLNFALTNSQMRAFKNTNTDNNKHFELPDYCQCIEAKGSQVAFAAYAATHNTKATVYDLAMENALANECEIVDDISKADIVFSAKLEDITDNREDKTLERKIYNPFEKADLISDMVMPGEEIEESMLDKVLSGRGSVLEDAEVENHYGGLIDVGHVGFVDEKAQILSGRATVAEEDKLEDYYGGAIDIGHAGLIDKTENKSVSKTKREMEEIER